MMRANRGGGSAVEFSCGYAPELEEITLHLRSGQDEVAPARLFQTGANSCKGAGLMEVRRRKLQLWTSMKFLLGLRVA
jgi:hypothetical protein